MPTLPKTITEALLPRGGAANASYSYDCKHSGRGNASHTRCAHRNCACKCHIGHAFRHLRWVPMSGLCSAHQDGDDPDCHICYPQTEAS